MIGLDEFQLPGQPGLSVIGSFDRKTSLYYQQVRALNLIWLLEQAGQLTGQRVCVLGGGIAGVTAAAALLRRGHSLTLLEKGPELLALQRHNHTRRIYPHLYAWPATGSSELRAGLPLLDWQAGLSADVAAGWLQEFTEMCRGQAEICLNAPATALEAVDEVVNGVSSSAYRVSWRDGESTRTQVFDHVILALGVGIERSVPGLPLHSYWQDDQLPQARGSRILVSGCGEGGLLEVLRLRLQDFDPGALLPAVADPELGQQLLAWEQAAPQTEDPARYVSERYFSLELPQLDQFLQSRLIKDLALTLHGPHPDSPLNLQGTILNRLLVSRLLKLQDIRYIGGTKLVQATAGEGHYQACFSDGSQQAFDAILIRHGASSAVKQQFSSLWEQALAHRPEGSSPELLQPLWPDQFFGPRPL